MLFILLRLVVFVLGGMIVIGTFISALRTFVLPRSAPDGISRTVFIWMRQLFELRKNRLHSYLEQDRAMEMYAPLSLIVLLIAWLGCIAIGYMGMYWAGGLTMMPWRSLSWHPPLPGPQTASWKMLLRVCYACAKGESQ